MFRHVSGSGWHTVSGGEVAGILVAVFWAILVSFLAVALARLAQTLKATTKLVADVTDQAVPLLADASIAVRSAQTQIDRVDAIASDVQEVTSNASALSTTVASTFGGPLVKVAAFGYGVRRAMGGRREGEAPGDQRRTVIVGRTVPGARRSKRSTRGKKD
ncbi:DUF948 domain-containing protein [Streptomyces neyagawaensis]|uniref:DUF948 domain-containing protein n=1 Tax=Streptomyces neyagawaensis TaxID=42238 RepID=UPI000D1A0483|nr:DUF948 domain-containing protein [Streptomyces neyagawaensis]MCL6735497.1 DUF948 domain-containing protein [Streptomyces neyagawaensis]MDE1682762.1 DUF948 domain-containing protein [Streptomyces neyagawaensis]